VRVLPTRPCLGVPASASRASRCVTASNTPGVPAPRPCSRRSVHLVRRQPGHLLSRRVTASRHVLVRPVPSGIENAVNRNSGHFLYRLVKKWQLLLLFDMENSGIQFDRLVSASQTRY